MLGACLPHVVLNDSYQCVYEFRYLQTSEFQSDVFVMLCMCCQIDEVFLIGLCFGYLHLHSYVVTRLPFLATVISDYDSNC